MSFTIRAARATDLAAVDALLARSYPRLLKADYPPSVLVTALPLISRAQPALLASGRYFVAETPEATILGAGGWSRDGKVRHRGHIRHLVTDDRMLRRGVGRALIRRALAQAGAQGITEMACWSTRTAVPFYAAMGFEELGPIEVPLRAGITFPSVQMRLTPVPAGT